MRRARLYGENQLTTSKPSKMPAEKTESVLFVLAFNADIAGQFETVQHSWINNRHSGAQYDEIDITSGQGDADAHNHTIQQKPANIQLENLADFVTMRGGGYFCMPAFSVLQI